MCTKVGGITGVRRQCSTWGILVGHTIEIEQLLTVIDSNDYSSMANYYRRTLMSDDQRKTKDINIIRTHKYVKV